jgi:peptidoglycan/LPS O-acetylase OafA/YrhL
MSEVSDSSTASAPKLLERRYDLDWLRVIAIVLVFIFHCARFFDENIWHIKNSESSMGMTIFVGFLGAFGMPFFFVLAGMSTFYAMEFMKSRKIKNSKYLLDRSVRLMVPFLIGIFTHITLQIYLERIYYVEFSGSFFDFYPVYFEGIYEFGGNFAIFGHHLWFLLLLFLFSVIAFPLFLFLRKENIRVKFLRITKFFRRPGMIYLLIIPIFLFELVNSFINGRIPVFGGWTIISQFFFYFYGFALALDKEFKTTIEKHAISAIIVVLISATGLGLTVFLFYYEALFLFFAAFYAWSWLIVLFALGSKFLNKNNKARKYLNELVLPFYILHQTIIIVIGFFVIPLNLAIFVKYIIIVVSAFIATSLLLLVIREENTLRFLFGMRIKKEKSIRRFFTKGDKTT